MPATYSARFMIGRGGWRTETYTVPEGKRAVILSVVFYGWRESGQRVALYVHGITIDYWITPGVGVQRVSAPRFTAYQRETIVVEVQGIDCSYSIDGWLLSDPGQGEPDDAHNVITPIPHVGTLPGGPGTGTEEAGA